MQTSARIILAAYNITPSDIVPLTGGLETDVWRVIAIEGTYTARRFCTSDQQLSSLSSELVWLDALSAHAVPVPRPVRLRDGTLAPVMETDVDGLAVAMWTLLEWVEGAPLGRLPTPDEARKVGKLTATMHNVARHWAPPEKFMRPRYDTTLFRTAADTLFANLGNALAHSDLALLEDAIVRSCAVLDQLWSEGRDIGVIHADLHDGNVLWSEDAPQPWAIDFGRCGTAPLALDVAMAQHYLTPELAEDLLDGYLAAMLAPPLDASSLASLRYLAAVENFAVLSRFPEEIENIVRDVPFLTSQACAV